MSRWFAVLGVVSAVAAAAPKEKLIVLDIVAGDESSKRPARLVGEQVLTELTQLGRYDVAGQSEISAVLGLERQRALLGCSEEVGSCMAELSGALGARWVLLGSLGRIGNKLRLDLKLIDATTGRAAHRAGKVLESDDEVFSAASSVLREVLGVQAATAPSKPVAAWVLGGVGVAAVIVGGVLMGLAASDGAALNTTRGQVAVSTALERMAGLQTQYWAGVGVGVVGLLAAGVGTGWLLLSGGEAKSSLEAHAWLGVSARGLEVRW